MTFYCRFYNQEIEYQAHANGIIQYWMYKRLNYKWLNVKTKHGFENLDLLKDILNQRSDMYSLRFTNKSLDKINKAHSEVKSSNPILYKSIDDYIKKTNEGTISPYFIDNVNSFCKLDGFMVLQNLLESQHELPDLHYINKVLDIVTGIKYRIEQDHRVTFYMQIKDCMFSIIDKYDAEQLKQIDKSELSAFVSSIEVLIDSAVDESMITDEIIENFELGMALKFINTSYIEKRILGINFLISKVNFLNKSNFPCIWKRKKSGFIKNYWLTSERFLEWLLKNKIFELFFGETLHSELVTKYYAVLSFLYSQDYLDNQHFEVMWDCAINKHETYRVNILKVLSALALKIKPSHAKFLYEKVKQMDQTNYWKFTLNLIKHINKNVWKGPVSDQAAHEAGLGKENKRNDMFDISGFGIVSSLSQFNLDMLSKNNQTRGRSFSLGRDDKEDTIKHDRKRHNSPDMRGSLLHKGDITGSLKRRPAKFSPKHGLTKDNTLELDVFDSARPKNSLKVTHEETKGEDLNKDQDKQSTDEEDKNKTTRSNDHKTVGFSTDEFGM